MWELVSDYVGALINVLLGIVFARIVTSDKHKIGTVSFLFLILVMSSIAGLFYYFHITYLKTFFTIFMFALIFKFTFKLDMNKVVILSLFFILITLLADILTIKLLTLIFGEVKFYEVFAGGVIGNIVVAILSICLTLLLKPIINKTLNMKIKYRLLVMLLFSLCCITAIFYETYNYGTNSIDNLIGFLYISIVVIILIYTFIQEYKNNQLILDYDRLLKFIKKYEVEIDNQRMLKHENKNQLLTIKSKIIDNEKNTEIVDYIDELLKERKNVKHAEYAKLAYLPSNGIKGLFYFKMSTAQEKNIKVDVSISKSIEDSFISQLDSNTFNQLGKILGVYLDNAIEGAEVSKDKKIGIEIFMKNQEAIFVISNSYNSNISKGGRSSKGAGRGYGLLLVNTILNNNKRMSGYTEITDNLYIKKLIIKK